MHFALRRKRATFFEGQGVPLQVNFHCVHSVHFVRWKIFVPGENSRRRPINMLNYVVFSPDFLTDFCQSEN